MVGTLLKNWWNSILWKVCEFGVFSGPCFLVLELNAKIYSVNLHIPSE